MFTIRRTSTSNSANLSVNVKPSAIYKLIVATLVIGSAALAGCGQKGDLYLTESSSQTVKDNRPELESTSHPQDAAFAKLDDNHQNNHKNQAQDAEGFQLPEPSSDPNDY